MNQRVSFLILAELGLGNAACAETQPSNNAEVAAPLVIPPMPSASASTAAPPRVPPPRAPAPTANAAVDDDDDDHPDLRPTPIGKPCRTSKDCNAPQQVCSVPTGRRVGACQTIQVIRGRPLLIDGHAKLAEYTRPPDSKRDARDEAHTPDSKRDARDEAHTPDSKRDARDEARGPNGDELASLREAAREEHASIAAFARTIAELMALGAPTWLLAETQRAMGDEIKHTARTLELLEHFTGERLELGPLPAAVAPLARSPAEFFRDVLRGGAIGETLAAEDAERRRLATNDRDLRAYYDMIVVDESRHAALAVKTLRWLSARATAPA